MPDSTTRTLFIGLGQMGRPMAANHARSISTAIHDVNAELVQMVSDQIDAKPLYDLSGELPALDTVILMVPNSRVVEQLMAGSNGSEGLLHRLGAGTLVIDMSSSEPQSTQNLAEVAAGLGIDYVDAPVSGGVSKATDGTLAILAGGAPAGVERAMPHLQTMGSSITVVGHSGAGHAAKALNNWLSATNFLAAAEVLTVATKFGISPATMIEAINSSTGRSQATEVKYPAQVLTGNYAAGFAIDLMLKDLGIADGLAAHTGTDTPVLRSARERAELARRTVAAADKSQAGGTDHTIMARFYELTNQVSFSDATD